MAALIPAGFAGGIKVATTVGIFLVALKRQYHQHKEKNHRHHHQQQDSKQQQQQQESSSSATPHVHRPPILAGPRPCMGDLSVLETAVNLVTCAPYFLMARGVPLTSGSIWNRIFSLSCNFTGLAAFLYHLSVGKIRHFFRRLDYTAVALSGISLTCARTTDKTRPLFLAAVSAVLAPFQPLVVSGMHILGTELAFLRRALGDPKLREKHFVHTCTGVAAFGAFYADDWFPQLPYLHASWHILSAYATSHTACLIQPATKIVS